MKNKIKNTNILINSILIILIFTSFCANSNNNNTNASQNLEMQFLGTAPSEECKIKVNEYNHHIKENIIGQFIVIGNEPFTKLIFRTEESKTTKSMSYRVVEECSEELWEYQAITLRLSGKIDKKKLETVTGKEMIIYILYPVSIEKLK